MNYQKFLLLSLLVFLLACNLDTVEEDPIMPYDNDLIFSPLMDYHNEISSNVLLEKRFTPGYAIKFKRVSGNMEVRVNAEACGRNHEVFISGKGVGTLVGKFSITNSYCTNGVKPVSLITGTITAEDGDELFVVVSQAWYEPSQHERYLKYIITGGSGKFTGACGYYILHGQIDFERMIWNLEGEGLLYL